MLRKMWDKVRGVVGAAAVVVVGVLGSGAVMAADPITIPEMPIDFSSIATAGVTTLGEIASAVAGVIVLSALIMMGFRWIKRAFAG